MKTCGIFWTPLDKTEANLDVDITAVCTMCSGSSARQAITCENVSPLDEDTLRQLLADARRGSTDDQCLSADRRGLPFSKKTNAFYVVHSLIASLA